jgi:hypothetical protein
MERVSLHSTTTGELGHSILTEERWMDLFQPLYITRMRNERYMP